MDFRHIKYVECGLDKAQWYAYMNTKINNYTYVVNQQMHTGKIYYYIVYIYIYIILLIAYMSGSHLLVYCINVNIPLRNGYE